MCFLPRRHFKLLQYLVAFLAQVVEHTVDSKVVHAQCLHPCGINRAEVSQAIWDTISADHALYSPSHGADERG